MSYLNIVLQTTVNFLYIPLLLYYIGREEYGLYQLMGSLIAYLSVMDFGLSTMVIRFYTRYRALGDIVEAENILAIAQRGYVFICLMILLVGSWVYPHLPQWFGGNMSEVELTEAMDIYLLLLVNFVMTMLGMVYQAVINAQQKYLFLRGTTCLQTILQPLLVLLVLQEYPHAFAVSAATTFLNMILIIWRVIYVRIYLQINIIYHYWNNTLLKGMGYFAFMQFIVVVVDMLFFKTNQVILGVVSGTAAVAVYSLADTLRNAYAMMSISISGVFLPYVTELVAKQVNAEVLSALFIRVGRLQFLVLGLISSGFIIFGKEFIFIWAGEGFADAYWMSLLIMLPFTTDLIQNIGFTILQAMNRYGIRAVVQTFVGVLNIALAIPLGVTYGGIGCAAATGMCMFIGNGVMMSYCYARYLNLNIRAFWLQILRLMIMIFILTGVVYLLNSILENIYSVNFVVKIFLYIITYAIYVYFLCCNDYEKALFLGGVKKLCKFYRRI